MSFTATDLGTAPALIPIYLRVSQILLAAPDPRLDDAIEEALGAVGAAVGVDRAYVFVIREGALDNTHEWTAAGIRPEKERLQAIPLRLMDAWRDSFAKGEPVFEADISAIPDRYADVRAVLQAQDILSLLVTPLMREGAPVGFVGFDAVLTKRVFTDTEVSVLRATANLIIAALDRREAQRLVRMDNEQWRRWSEAGVGAAFRLEVPDAAVSDPSYARLTWCSGRRSWLGLPAGPATDVADDAFSLGVALSHVDPPERADVLAALATAVARAEPWHASYHLVDHDGALVRVRIVALPEHPADAGGPVRTFSGVATAEAYEPEKTPGS